MIPLHVVVLLVAARCWSEQRVGRQWPSGSAPAYRRGGPGFESKGDPPGFFFGVFMVPTPVLSEMDVKFGGPAS